MRDNGVLDFVNAFTTVVLASFAFIELRRARNAEREKTTAGYGALAMTYYGVLNVSSAWREEAILNHIRAGVFDPTAIIPKDWGALVPIISQLGPRPARLAGYAYTMATTTAVV